MKKILVVVMAIVVMVSFSCEVSCAKSKVTDWRLVKSYCSKHYKGYKVKKVGLFDKRIDNRKGKKIVYVEKVISISNGHKGGIIKGKWYIAYNKKVKKGKKVISYVIYNPHTNYCDDIVAVVDNKMIR